MTTPDRTALADRAAGTLIGAAIGDALGVPYEFATPPKRRATMKGGGLGPYKPGEWSDDTQLTALIAMELALLPAGERECPDLYDQVADAFDSWEQNGATDVGAQTRAVLTAARTVSARQAAYPADRAWHAARAYHRDHPATSAGNGALMRTAPVALAFLTDRVSAASAARLIAELTHADPRATAAAVLWTEAIRVAVTDQALDVRGGLDLLLNSRQRDFWEQVIREAEFAPPAANGDAVGAFQAAWYTLTHTPRHVGPEAALHAAVRLGGDTDTVASITGALAGALAGASAFPKRWVEKVHGWPGLDATDLTDLAVTLAGENR